MDAVCSYLGQALAMFVMAAGFILPSLKHLSAPIAVGGTLAYILAFALVGGGRVPWPWAVDVDVAVGDMNSEPVSWLSSRASVARMAGVGSSPL